jgi:hypothetical protein
MEIPNLIATYAMQFIVPTSVVMFISTGITMFLPTQLKTKKKAWYITTANATLKTLNILAGNVLKNKNAK